MNTNDLTREQLYLMLKEESPALAIGKSRARREELEQLLEPLALRPVPYIKDAEPRSSSDSGVFTPSFAPTISDSSSKPRRSKRVRKTKLPKSGFVGDFLEELEDRLYKPVVNASDIERTRHGLDMIDAAGELILRSGIDATQLGHLICLTTDVSAVDCTKVIKALMALKNALIAPAPLPLKEKAA